MLSFPTLLGATALTLATAGALAASASPGDSSASASIRSVSGHPALADGSTMSRGEVLAGREHRAVSRDSSRQARARVADKALQAVAEKQARRRDAALAAIAVDAEKQGRRLARDAWGLPVSPGAYHLTSRFGDCSSLWSHCHTGLDFAAPDGTPVHAVARGTITETEYAGAYGNRTIETLPNGTQLWYAHQSAFTVEVGDRVSAGEVIGAVGSTGNTTGPHVHLEVRPRSGASAATAGGSAEDRAGEPIDPFRVLVQHGLKP